MLRDQNHFEINSVWDVQSVFTSPCAQHNLSRSTSLKFIFRTMLRFTLKFLSGIKKRRLARKGEMVLVWIASVVHSAVHKPPGIHHRTANIDWCLLLQANNKKTQDKIVSELVEPHRQTGETTHGASVRIRSTWQLAPTCRRSSVRYTTLRQKPSRSTRWILN